jgi:hypothetical protein
MSSLVACHRGRAARIDFGEKKPIFVDTGDVLERGPAQIVIKAAEETSLFDGKPETRREHSQRHFTHRRHDQETDGDRGKSNRTAFTIAFCFADACANRCVSHLIGSSEAFSATIRSKAVRQSNPEVPLTSRSDPFRNRSFDRRPGGNVEFRDVNPRSTRASLEIYTTRNELRLLA